MVRMMLLSLFTLSVLVTGLDARQQYRDGIGEENMGEPNLEIVISPDPAPYGELISFIVTNVSGEYLVLPNTAPWFVWDDQWRPVYAPGWLAIIIPFPPGAVVTYYWEQVGIDLEQVDPGDYFVCVDYYLDTFPLNECESFSILEAEANLACLPENLAVDGTWVDLSVTVTNSGTAATPGCELGYYLTPDTVVTPSEDCQIGIDEVPELQPGESSSEDIGVNVAFLCSDGVYFVGFYIDPDDVAEEIDEFDNAGFFNSPLVIISAGGVPDRDDSFPSIPVSFRLSQNYPNPFNPTTNITYDIPSRKDQHKVRLSIYDLRGHQVRILVDGEQKPGRYTVQWDGRDGHGIVVPSGIYLYRIQWGDVVETKRMVVLK
jgi:hypothetical protein